MILGSPGSQRIPTQEFKALSGQGEVQCLMQWALRQALAFWES